MDTYTKMVLTVIAAALSMIAVESGTGAARAAGDTDTPMKVAICSQRDPSVCADVSRRFFFVHDQH